jgi:hypothetical protein
LGEHVVEFAGGDVPAQDARRRRGDARDLGGNLELRALGQLGVERLAIAEAGTRRRVPLAPVG